MRERHAITEIISEIFRTFYRAVTTAVIVFGVILGMLYLCGIRVYRVKTGSMGELLPVGSACFVSSYTSYDSICAGDVIAFRVHDDVLVTHRAVAVAPEGITTQGDCNEMPDPDPVTKENYIGKIVFALPHLGETLGFFHTAKGIAVLCSSAVLLLIAGALYKDHSE